MTTLVLRKAPNLRDKRVVARIEKVLAWCADELSEKYARPLPKQVLEGVFGPVGNRIGDYLRAHLLDREGNYVRGKQFYKYRLKKGGTERVVERAKAASSSIVNTSDPLLVAERMAERHAGELATLQFQYRLRSNRYWHSLQNLKKSVKQAFWTKHGLSYDYDIEACAPTILLQLAARAGMLGILQGPIQDYLADRDRYRRRVMELTGLSYDDAKRLVTSLFNGARIGPNSRFMGFTLLRENGLSHVEACIVMNRLKADRDIRMLRSAIRMAWRRLRFNLRGKFRTGREKWQLYYVMEKQVMDAMRTALDCQGRRYFTEHDGFRSDQPVDVAAIVEHVKQVTGFKIALREQPPAALL